MKILIDMNLSPGWVGVLMREGWQAAHWSTLGDPRAPDEVIMDWARANGYVVFTHDLDFGTLLATTHADQPSVIQVRIQDVMPARLGNTVVRVLRAHENMLLEGALLTIDERKSRVRILPLRY
jgi:predicted nuclease of predicted toxin-antitoxin system